MATIIDGKTLATTIKQSLIGSTAVLGIITVGTGAATESYIRNKFKACAETGMGCYVDRLPEETVTTEGIIEAIHRMDEIADGIIVQLPVPKHIDLEAVTAAIPVDKDVDCFKPENIGKVFLGTYDPETDFAPCTPAGIMDMLGDVTGLHCVIVGRSNIVGKPLAAMLINAGATVTVCNSHTKDLASITRQADVLISAVGKPNFIKLGMVKDHAIVIDVGITRNADGKLCGDCCENVAHIAEAITPVPGGVGPMTVAMLLKNVVKAAKKQKGMLCHRNGSWVVGLLGEALA